MGRWTADELDTIGSTDELRIAALRADGTLRGPVTIWVVRVGDDLYVRSYRDKYRNYGASFVDPMITGIARNATVKLVPR